MGNTAGNKMGNNSIADDAGANLLDRRTNVGGSVCDHAWTVLLFDDGMGAVCYRCGAERRLPTSDALDIILHGATYKRVAQEAQRYLTDLASMDVPGRTAAFDRFHDGLRELSAADA
jgi:hypothetical protein